MGVSPHAGGGYPTRGGRVRGYAVIVSAPVDAGVPAPTFDGADAGEYAGARGDGDNFREGSEPDFSGEVKDGERWRRARLADMHAQ